MLGGVGEPSVRETRFITGSFVGTEWDDEGPFSRCPSGA